METVSPISEIDAVLERAKETAKQRAANAQPMAVRRKRLRPRHEWVVIRKIDPRDKLSQGGLVITEGQARSSVGEVISVAKRNWWQRLLHGASDLQRGDVVLYTNFAIQLDEMEDATGDKTLFLVRDEEVYTVLEDED